MRNNRRIKALQILAIAGWTLTACVGVEVIGEPGAPTTSVAPSSAEPSGDAVVLSEEVLSEEVLSEDELAVEETTTTTAAPVTLSGQVVSAIDGASLAGAVITMGDSTVVTGADGGFELTEVQAGLISVSRPVWIDQEIQWSDDLVGAAIEIEMEPFVARALRVPAALAADSDRFDEVLKTASETTVNALVFDTKDETDHVLYQTEVALAHEIGVVENFYDPVALVAKAHAADLYTITRIVTFEDPAWAKAVPEAKLAGSWVDAANEDNWDYPISLAVEACSFGFDEIQFDYVRFPSGRTAAQARDLVPQTSQERVDVITGFLAKAKAELHPMGCGVSAAIFGIVLSSPDDQRLGQTPEAISGVADAISPMIYPSHYNSGWLGLDNPNSHPGLVVGDALDSGMPRLAPGSLMRPWIQGFYYGGDQVMAQIAEAERHGAGWIIWNIFGNYERSWLPELSN